MLRDIRKNKIFNRRVFLLGAGQSALAGALILRLGYLQLWKHEEYSVQSDSNRIKPMINPAPRGTVFDRHGLPLTKNDNNFRLFLYLDKKRNTDELIAKLAQILDLSAQDKEMFLAKVKNSRRKSVISLIDNLGWDDLARIETNSHLLSGISIESGIIRRYPYPLETAHFLGYVSLPSEKEIDENEQALFMSPDFRVGKAGIEKTFDEALRGKYGVKYVEVNAHEIPLRTLSVKPTIDGSRISLTIDFPLQKFVAERIKNDAASVVVMDVKTGEILAYASSPSFDPNRFVEGISKEYWQELNDDLRKPLNNKPISALYPPGSTFKLMVVLAALESGFNPATRVYCNGYYRLGRRVFHCWKEEGHGTLDLMGGIMHSCNTYFFTVANQIGYEKFTEMARRFGYGEKLDISLYGARSGLVPSDEWKRKVFNQPWVGGDTLNTAIGQGNVLATPLQMALVTARIANGGVPIKPYLVRNHNIYKQFDELKNEPLIKNSFIKFVQEGMNRVVNEPGGTAYGKRIAIKGFEMAGKTGTSQVISKREKEMSKAEADANANHAIFVGFAPVHDPKYSISVVVEHGKSGSMTAAPIGKDVMMKVQGV
ncbi:MAG: penicillin-binding protein 2 [Alphaproteobacteria bacterium RIFCSPLOWO2_01_FULL_40_26]|nr:MAG: penicillin-binding protein 2 [Alphaproteobacteria bacterium RIFCSPHIGHO2_02_FULL_40_34]OFW94355.1 MAG: penicillin-binding protein 2 [Alphaproteobacteria bacterium RIFCSPLOWO2_01_FULL_40_26]OFX09497.1 MAG: penicillin-binding protein 2 [Alphaproteobacteria bacterium RIFCSPLOWO2_02_FULL_40_19]OFX11128.1 MAG: penicillin-binding protein 2 [Alphaproteobacteria bacterium RIFCSPLOWO2_12_FULL_40_11]